MQHNTACHCGRRGSRAPVHIAYISTDLSSFSAILRGDMRFTTAISSVCTVSCSASAAYFLLKESQVQILAGGSVTATMPLLHTTLRKCALNLSEHQPIEHVLFLAEYTRYVRMPAMQHSRLNGKSIG
jgi:hypothetical protein